MLEYLARMIAFVKTWGDFKHFVKAPTNLVDVASFVPFYFDLFLYISDMNSWVNINLQVLTVFRVVKLLKLIKLTRYSAKFQLLVVSIKRSLDMLISIAVLVFMGALICSTLVYYAERGQYDSRSGRWLRSDGTDSPFSNILVCMWYSVVTIATVGYGDMAPVTVLGRIIAITTILSGIVIVALPSMVVGGIYSKLLNEYEIQISKKKLEGNDNIENEEFDVVDNDDTISQGEILENSFPGEEPTRAPVNSGSLLSFDHVQSPRPVTQAVPVAAFNQPTTNNSIESGFFSAFGEVPVGSNPLIYSEDQRSLRTIFDRQDSIIRCCRRQLEEMKQLSQEVKTAKMVAQQSMQHASV